MREQILPSMTMQKLQLNYIPCIPALGLLGRPLPILPSLPFLIAFSLCFKADVSGFYYLQHRLYHC